MEENLITLCRDVIVEPIFKLVVASGSSLRAIATGFRISPRDLSKIPGIYRRLLSPGPLPEGHRKPRPVDYIYPLCLPPCLYSIETRAKNGAV